MAPRPRASAPLLLTAALVCAACGAEPRALQDRPSGETAAASPAPPAAPLVVAIVVDQLAAWSFEERAPELPSGGGFARLRREARAEGTLAFGHAVNATAPGHAALFTGAAPRESGIVSNEALRFEGGYQGYLTDDASRLVCSGGVTDRKGPSLARLRVPTVADAMRAVHPGARVVSLSMKDRAAVFGGGRAPDAALFWDSREGGFCTATPFGEALPAWARTLASPAEAKRRFDRVWAPADEGWLRRVAGPADAELGQGDFDGLGARFPHAVASSTKPASSFRATPEADALLVDLAIAALPALAEDRASPRLLALSLSANDYVGHVFGVDSWEAWDQLRRLDAELARLFDALDRSEGPDGWALVLSADHGAPPTPEARARGGDAARAARFGAGCGGAHRHLDRALADRAESIADRLLGPGDWVLGLREPYLVLTERARALEPAKRDALLSAIAAGVSREPGVASVVDVRAHRGACPPLEDESITALVCRAIHAEESAELYVVFDEGSFVDTGYVEGKGVNHGSPYRYDREVPILVRAPGSAGAPTRGVRVDHRAYAATLASLLGVAPPPSARGGVDLSATSAPAGAVGAAPAPSAGPARRSPFPPAAIAPPVERTKKAGDGRWTPLAVRGGEGAPPLARTVLHPHRFKPFVVVEVVAIDPTRLDLELVSGTEEPEAPHVPETRRTGLVPQARLAALVAAMNGGFKRRHGQNGMRVGADELVPFRADGCVVAKTRDGYALGPWSELAPRVPELAWARQTPPCLVHAGKRHPDVAGEYGQKKWGAAEDGNKEIRRSALGISADGETLYFAIGDWVNAEALADAMLAVGATTALELDINYSYTRFVLYEGAPRDEPVATSPLLKELKFGRTEYWKSPSARDFFYLAWREGAQR